MSEAKYCLVARASILASGATDDFHHVAPDEVVLVSVEALEQARRERDDETRKRYAAERERDEARRRADLRGAQLAMLSSEVDGDPKLHWLHDRSDPRWTPALQEAWALRQRLKELAAQTQKAEAVAARLREALESVVVIGERCNCDGYCGPCGCGERAEDVAREALGEVES